MQAEPAEARVTLRVQAAHHIGLRAPDQVEKVRRGEEELGADVLAGLLVRIVAIEDADILLHDAETRFTENVGASGT